MVTYIWLQKGQPQPTCRENETGAVQSILIHVSSMEDKALSNSQRWKQISSVNGLMDLKRFYNRIREGNAENDFLPLKSGVGGAILLCLIWSRETPKLPSSVSTQPCFRWPLVASD